MADKRVKVKMLTHVGTMPIPEHDIHTTTNFEMGKEYLLHPDRAKLWINCGHCEPVPETATK